MPNQSPLNATRRLLDENEVADILRVARKTLQIWRASGRGPRFVKVGRRALYRSTDLETYLDERTVNSTARFGRGGRDDDA